MRSRRWVAPVVVGAIVTAAYTVLAAWQWSHLVVRSWDLSIFTQLLQSYSRLQAPIVNVKGDGYNLLGDHFHPLLAVLAPPFALFPHAFTLLVVQAVCFGASAGMFTAIATCRLGGRAVGALLGTAFGLSWGLQSAAEAQFHEIALAVPLLTGTVGALLDRRWRAAMLWAAPLVFVKEDLGLTVFAIGVMIAVLARSPRGLWLAAWGLAWFGIATLLVLPALNPDGAWAYASNADPGGLLAHPEGWFHPSKGHTLLLLLVTTAGFLLRSPLTVLLGPTLAWRFLSTNEGYWGPTWHYSAVLMPIAFGILLDGIERAHASRWMWLRAYARQGATVAITVAAMLLPQLPLAGLLVPGAWAPPERGEAAASVLAAVPEGASVETDVGLMSYLVDDHDVYWIGNANRAPDCILIDRISGGTPREWGDVLGVARILHADVAYEVVRAEGEYELACADPAD